MQPKPPPKPLRTFAHDIYVQNNQEMRALVDQKFRGKKCDDMRYRRRSRSADACVDVLFEQPPAIRSIIRQSFGRDGGLPPLSELVEDDQQAADYARTLRHGLKKRTISHYTSVADIANGEARLCKYVTVYDKISDSVTLHPVPSDSEKPDFVKKFLSQTCRDESDKFCWFAYTDQHFFYTYFMSQEKRVLALSSHLFSPRFFSAILQAVAAQSGPSSLLTQVMHELVTQTIPLPGQVMTLKGSEIQVPWQMPQVTASKSSILLTHMEPEAIVKSVSTLVQEKRLVFISRDAGLLVDASKSLLSLIYPLAWDYMYWPFVPDDLVKLCAAFTLPYFICLRPDQFAPFQEALTRREQKILIVDLDSHTVPQETGCETRILPKQYILSVTTALHLSRNMTDPTDSLRDRAVQETFQELFCRLLGPVTPHISDGTFSKETFIRSLDREHRSFFHWFSETRLFENFVKYWQVRAIHSKYVPLATKRTHMDMFEMRTERMRLQLNKKPGTTKETTTGWSRSAMRVVEKRIRAISDKMTKTKNY